MEALLGRDTRADDGDNTAVATVGSSIEYEEDSLTSDADELKSMLEEHARVLTERLKTELTQHAESVAAMAEVTAAPIKHKPYHSTPLTGLSLSASVIKDEATGLIF